LLEGPRIRTLDLRQPLPYEDDSIDAIFHEHFIEHLTKQEGERFLSETYRVLKPGGAMRIGWPDLQRLLRAYFFKRGKFKDYVLPALAHHHFGGFWDEIFSDCMFDWEHRYAYTARHLSRVLMAAGFREVNTMSPGESRYGIALDFRRDPATTYLEAHK
jgi:predicted SAM-dependent methyltransferase